MTSRYFLDRIASRDASLRAADADRERTAERLRDAHAEGRLDLDELQQRLDRCYEAKTFGELDTLVSDLPRTPTPEQRRRLSLRPWRVRVVTFALVALALAVVSGSAAHHHAGWLWIPVLFVFLRLTWWRRRSRWWTGPRRGWDA